jgi:predicted nucleic acid-binding protein
VLEKFYKIPKQEIIGKIKPLILFGGFVTQTSKVLLLEALDLWGDTDIDWTDAFLSAISKRERFPIVSFDTDFDSISGVERKIP